MSRGVVHGLLATAALAACSAGVAGTARPSLAGAVAAARPAVPAGTTGVGLVYFTAARNAKPNLKKKVLVKWKTGAEPETVGFRLYRQVGTKKTRIGKLFASKGAIGGVYSYTDTLPKTVAKACYAVDVVSTQGVASPLGKACMKK